MALTATFLRIWLARLKFKWLHFPKHRISLTCVSLRISTVCSMSASLREFFLPELSFCFFWASSPLVCCSLELLLGVSDLLSPLLGVMGAWLVLLGTFLIVSSWGLRRNLNWRGLSSAAEVAGSVRGFLRGLSLVLVSITDSVCFLFAGFETSYVRWSHCMNFKSSNIIISWLQNFRYKSIFWTKAETLSRKLLISGATSLMQQYLAHTLTYRVILSACSLRAINFFLRSCQWEKILLS